MSPEPAKAARYIQQLDASRCNGEWTAVPELVRKVRKHAPERVCLALAAENEYAVIQALKDRPSSSVSWSASGLGRLVGPLVEAIKKEKTFVEDEFHAQVCLGWIHWVSAEPALACASLPVSIEQEFVQLDGTGKASAAWTRVCALKASYIKGASLHLTGAPMKAFEIFRSALPILSTTSSNSTIDSAEHRIWAEIMLSQFCLLSSEIISQNIAPLVESEALSAFRAWAAFWKHQPSQGASAPGGYIPHSGIPRRQTWKQYHTAVSKIMQNGLPSPITPVAPSYMNISTRAQLIAELHRVESSYESILLREVLFPKADEASQEVEEWIHLVMGNWKVLSGSGWQGQEREQNVGESGSRRVLDILYRAATKTFHSTSILRNLFTVHLAVGEFDIAFKAFDTYLEIVNKRKAQVEKTGEVDEGLDSDEIVLTTASACITALCRYGSRHAAAKAKDLGQHFEDWLTEHEPQNSLISTTNGNVDDRHAQNDSAPLNAPSIHPHVFAGAWRAIGIAKAQWARVSFDANSRPQVQTQAIKCLRRALSLDYKSTNNVDGLFALALVLAERRELGAAIEIVKRALLPPHPPSPSEPNQLKPFVPQFSRERSLIPLWHLLALLLSARQEFTTAIRACEGAFEQFQDPKYLFGEARLDGVYRSEHLNKVSNEKPSMRTRGLVDDIDDFEKEAILEVKMTQLTLIEILEGSDVAVNASDELLSLYARLFGEPHKLPLPNISQTLPPQSSAGTLRSLKGSIFGRSRQSIRKTAMTRGNMTSVSEKSTLPVRPHTSQTDAHVEQKAPTIQVTDENNGAIKQSPHQDRLHKRSMSLPRKKSQSSMRNRSTSASETRTRNRLAAASDITEGDRLRLRSEQSTLQPDPALQPGVRVSQVGLAISPDIPSATPSPSPENLKSSSSKASSAVSRNVSQTDEQPTQDSPSEQKPCLSSPPFVRPITRFTKDQERRRRIGTLLRVWLLVAGFYRRAEMFDDARGAVEEAYTLVNGLEGDISRDKSGNVSIYDSGWGIAKSVEELWGDVWCEYGYLSSAKGSSYVALSDFEHALTHFPDHPSAIVGLSNILLDIYSEALLPPSDLPQIGPSSPISTPSQSTVDTSNTSRAATQTLASGTTISNPTVPQQSGPLGFRDATAPSRSLIQPNGMSVSRTALLDRLAARDRAYGLLSGLTKLGTGWNYSEAWFALARAHEEAGQLDKARDALWWCVELEEGKGVRNWDCIVPGGYVL